MKRKLALLLVFVLMVGILGGCNKKAPEGVSQAFYDDMMDSIKKVKGTDWSTGYGNVLKYKDVKDTLSKKEQDILKSIGEIYTYVSLNDSDTNLFIDDIEKHLEVFTRLMDIDVDIDKVIKN